MKRKQVGSTKTASTNDSRLLAEVADRILQHGAELALPIKVEVWSEGWQRIAAIAAAKGESIDETVSALVERALEVERLERQAEYTARLQERAQTMGLVALS